tara:strand:+ start:203 stop:337 length:135 start_codon:yes stop_codon:yes gene_type:complete
MMSNGFLRVGTSPSFLILKNGAAKTTKTKMYEKAHRATAKNPLV